MTVPTNRDNMTTAGRVSPAVVVAVSVVAGVGLVAGAAVAVLADIATAAFVTTSAVTLAGVILNAGRLSLVHDAVAEVHACVDRIPDAAAVAAATAAASETEAVVTSAVRDVLAGVPGYFGDDAPDPAARSRAGRGMK